MQTHLLRLFAEVAAAGSISRVANERGQVQSHLSRQLTQLEHECGGALFYRTGRGVVLSELGQQILPKVQTWLSTTDALIADIKSTSGTISGTVRIGIMPAAAPLIVELFRYTQQHYPDIKLQVSEIGGLLENWVATGKVDIGILFRYQQALTKTEQPLGNSDVYLIGCQGDALTQQKTVPFAKLAHIPLAVPARGSDLRDTVDQLARQQHIQLNIAVEANSVNFQRSAVLDGLCHALMSTAFLQRDLATGRLQAARVIKPHIRRNITLAVSPQGPLSIACKTVINLLKTLASHDQQLLMRPMD